MVKVDLITGFLGAGKTTFIHKYISWLRARGLKVLVIENEFGNATIDTKLLEDDDCDINDLTGCCMCCSGKEKFETMLITSAHDGYDRVLVEPSGIYDVDEFFSSILRDDIRDHCEIGAVITIVDADMEPDLSDETRYMVFSQLSAAGTILLSKSQLTSPEKVDQTRCLIKDIMEFYAPGSAAEKNILVADWASFTDADFEQIAASGYVFGDHKVRGKALAAHEETYKALQDIMLCRDPDHLNEILDQLLHTDTYGRIFRMKGHIKDLSGQWYEVNAARNGRTIRPVELKRGMYVIIGEGMDGDKIKQLFVPKPPRKKRQLTN
ncbi:MAG: CobW family GTP-binding protein [Lachnospiraceae bacterium]